MTHPTPLRPYPRKIADGLWQSALAHVMPHWPQLKSEVSYIALLATPAEPLPSDVPVIYFPFDDNANGCSVLPQVMDLAKRLANSKVLTVCHMGENRSGLLSAAILIARGMDPISATSTVQMNGPHNSSSQPHSFWNPGFNKQILDLR